MTHPLLAYVGWFDSPEQTEPVYDPGIDGGKCLYCAKPLSRPVLVVSFLRAHSQRSYFYRAHKLCREQLSEVEQWEYESSLVDGLPMDDSLVVPEVQA